MRAGEMKVGGGSDCAEGGDANAVLEDDLQQQQQQQRHVDDHAEQQQQQQQQQHAHLANRSLS